MQELCRNSILHQKTVLQKILIEAPFVRAQYENQLSSDESSDSDSL